MGSPDSPSVSGSACIYWGIRRLVLHVSAAFAQATPIVKRRDTAHTGNGVRKRVGAPAPSFAQATPIVKRRDLGTYGEWRSQASRRLSGVWTLHAENPKNHVVSHDMDANQLLLATAKGLGQLGGGFWDHGRGKPQGFLGPSTPVVQPCWRRR